MTVGTIRRRSAERVKLFRSAASPLAPVTRRHRAVIRAWRAVFGRGPDNVSMTLQAAGCDSLALLQYHYALERCLGCPIPLELIDTHMTAAEIAVALSSLPRANPPPDERPLVFLLPGLDDDEPRLARFRRALRHQVRFQLVEYPGWPEMMRPGWNFAELAESVLAQVVTAAQGGPILLTGYSFGGEVGFAVARRLVALGHDLRWLAILDTDLTRVPGPPTDGRLARLWSCLCDRSDGGPRGLHKAAGLILAKLARTMIGLPRFHRAERWWRRIVPSRTAFWFDRRTRSIQRIEALWAWLESQRTATLDAPVTLFRATDRPSASPPHLGWGPRCPRLTIVPVSGNHHTLFDPPHCDVLYARYAEAVGELAAHPAGKRHDAAGMMASRVPVG